MVITASMGESSPLYTPAKYRADDGITYVAFTDRPIKSDIWDVRQVPRLFADSNRDAKRFKVRPSEHVPKADATIWIDRHCRLTCDPRAVFDEFPEDVIAVNHYRSCVFREARVCIDRTKDVAAIIRPMMERFRLEGHPVGAGLYYGGFIARRHTEADDRFSRLWWNYIETGSKRDQLSLPVALARSGVSFRAIKRKRRGEFFAIRKR